jgi:hypothetical protein
LSWIEDHAERMVKILVALLLLGGAAGLLWSWAQVTGLVICLAAIVAIALDMIQGAGAVLCWLQRRRAHRLPPDAGAEAPVLTYQTSASALSEAGGDGEDGKVGQASAAIQPEADEPGRVGGDRPDDGKSNDRS